MNNRWFQLPSLETVSASTHVMLKKKNLFHPRFIRSEKKKRERKKESIRII